MKLDKDQFLEAIAKMPLVSMDMVIRDSKNRILLGRRVNEPARGKWFVPGGRILKGESLDAAFGRISIAEIGERHSRHEARLIGAFTNIYETNVFLKEGISTHYVVLAYELHLADDIADRIRVSEKSQHSEYKWFSGEEADPDVHEYISEYFRVPSVMDNGQYEILNARRDSFNTLVWQTPVVSLTALAFLFVIVLSGGVPQWGRIVAAILASMSALMSIQLLGKHRFMEEYHARILHQYEEINNWYPANCVIRATNWPERLSSYRLWKYLLWIFFFAAVVSLLNCLGLWRFLYGAVLALWR